jgi:hypothetical protein
MRVLVSGASGAIGTRLVPQLIDRGHEVIGTFRSPGHVRACTDARGGSHRARSARRARCSQGRPRSRARGDRPQATALADVRFSRNLDRSFAQTNRLRTEGTDALLPAAHEAGVAPVRGAELRQLSLRPRGRAGQDRGGSSRPHAGASSARDQRRDTPSRPGGHGGRRDRASLWRLLRRLQRWAARARAHATVPDHRQRRRRLLVHPLRRRRRSDRARTRTRRSRHLQHR